MWCGKWIGVMDSGLVIPQVGEVIKEKQVHIDCLLKTTE